MSYQGKSYTECDRNLNLAIGSRQSVRSVIVYLQQHIVKKMLKKSPTFRKLYCYKTVIIFIT